MSSTSREIHSFDSSQLSSSMRSSRWDVFLNFRGIDTRMNFTGHLYKALDRHGIQTFMDDSTLQSGEEISPALLEAIEESKICVVVFSKNYASSRWSLDELVKIHECWGKTCRLVIPVFYKVIPSDVRYQTGCFEDAFVKHEIRCADKIDKWRVALSEAAQFSGYHIDKTKSEADIVEKVVERILLEINPMLLNVAKYPVGIDFRVKNITPLLRTGAKGVHTVGIYGMGGVGKTTLAKAVYNQNIGRFQGSCFLANVSQVARQPKGREGLQEQLLTDVLKCKKFTIDDIDKGISFIRRKICSKRVLIVLDDLDHQKQLDYLLVEEFAPGSLIIITTRDNGLLDTIQVKDRCMVHELDYVESQELFNRHAFGNVKPSATFMQLSKEILHHAGGLPLALEVFGSNLVNQHEIGYWGNFIEKLQRIPNDNVQEKLMISFDALDDPMLKKIFLDIACFFIGENKDNAVIKLDTCYRFSDDQIKILEKKCLLTVNDNNELWMHDLLRDMGRKIARNKSCDQPGEYSRLWDREEICNLLKYDEGTEVIEGIVPHPRSYCGALYRLSSCLETFKRMPKLRFLYLEDVNLTGSFKKAFKNLRWLHWYSCPSQCLPSDFCPQKLVILELPFSRLNKLWDNAVVLEKLTILDLSYSYDLTTTPDFTGLPCLERLILQGCESLVEVDTSVGSLVRLVYLDLAGCKKLTSLPSSICDLKALESIHLNDSIDLEELPEELGRIECLRVIDLSNTKIRTLPGSICNLRALESLNVGSCCNLEALPMELGNSKSLRKLDASSTAILKLPNSIGCLCKLLELNLENNGNLEILPDTLCNLRGLEFLNISHCSKLEGLPDRLGMIESLRELHSVGNNLKRLPDIQRLSSLRELNLSKNEFTALPLSISQLSSLGSLRLKGCSLLRSIEELPPNLRELELDGCTSMEKIPNLSNFKNLEILNITDCIHLREIQGLKKLLNYRKLHIQGFNSSFLKLGAGETSLQRSLSFMARDAMPRLHEPDPLDPLLQTHGVSIRTRNHLPRTDIPEFFSGNSRRRLRFMKRMQIPSPEIDVFWSKTENNLGRTEFPGSPEIDVFWSKTENNLGRTEFPEFHYPRLLPRSWIGYKTWTNGDGSQLCHANSWACYFGFWLWF